MQPGEKNLKLGIRIKCNLCVMLPGCEEGDVESLFRLDCGGLDSHRGGHGRGNDTWWKARLLRYQILSDVFGRIYHRKLKTCMG